MAAEKKAKHEIEELKGHIRKMQEAERKERRKLAEEDAIRKIKKMEERIAELEKNLTVQKQVRWLAFWGLGACLGPEVALEGAVFGPRQERVFHNHFIVSGSAWTGLTHWGRVTHICVGKLTNIGSDNGLLPGRRQAIIWTNAGILLIGPLGTNFSEFLIVIHRFSFNKMHLKMSSAKWRPFCLGLNVLTSSGTKDA